MSNITPTLSPRGAWTAPWIAWMAWVLLVPQGSLAGPPPPRKNVPPATLQPAVADSAPLMDVHPYIHGNKFENFPEFIETSSPDPEKNQCVPEDPLLGTRVCKDEDARNLQALNPAITVVRPAYMRWTNENADGSKYFLNHGEIPPKLGKGQMTIYNSADNSFSSRPNLNTHENQEFRWDATDPNKMYYRAGCSFYSFDLTTNQYKLLHNFAVDFPGCTRAINAVEGDSSLDSRIWAFMLYGAYKHGYYPLMALITYDKEQDRIVGVLDRQKFIAQGGNADSLWDTYGYGPNMVDIAPSGDRVLALWPGVKYPVDDAYQIPSADKVVVESGIATIQTATSNAHISPGHTLTLFGCQGDAKVLNNRNWMVTAVDSRQQLRADVSTSELANGKYTCTSFRLAIKTIAVSGGVATVTTGYRHQLKEGVRVTIYGSNNPALNGAKRVTAVPGESTFQFAAAINDEVHAEEGMYLRDERYGRYIPDGDYSFPETKAHDQVGNDGPHVYTLDFSNPIKVCNADTHSGWAWDLNGDPVFVCQINNLNWSQAPADTVGFTNIYTGVYTPVFYHADLSYQSGWHFGRFYDRNIRGWGVAMQADNPGTTNKLRNTLFFFELKHASEQPRIWRAARLHNYHYNYDTEAHGCLTRDAQKFRWGANWDGDKSALVHTYSVALPSNWWSILNNATSAENAPLRRAPEVLRTPPGGSRPR